MSGPKLRHATREDVPIILGMIHELATHIKCQHEVFATAESLEASLSFASTSPDSDHTNGNGINGTNSSTSTSHHSPGYAKALLIVAPDGAGDEIAGMALYFHNFSTWRGVPGIYLEDLFVRPEFRGRGYATELIRALAREVLEMKVPRAGGTTGRLVWICYKENHGALKLYQKLGMRRMDELVEMRMEGEEQLKELAYGKQ